MAFLLIFLLMLFFNLGYFDFIGPRAFITKEEEEERLLNGRL